jgi:hypothetical protein
MAVARLLRTIRTGRTRVLRLGVRLIRRGQARLLAVRRVLRGRVRLLALLRVLLGLRLMGLRLPGSIPTLYFSLKLFILLCLDLDFDPGSLELFVKYSSCWGYGLMMKARLIQPGLLVSFCFHFSGSHKTNGHVFERL